MQTKTETGASGADVVALVCYGLALAGVAALAARVVSLGLGFHWHLLTLAEPWAWLVDLGWLGLFGLQHSGMARTPFKEWWTRFIPANLERSVYVGVAGLLSIAMSLNWQPIAGDALWSLPWWLEGMALLGVIGVSYCTRYFDQRDFLGLVRVTQPLQSSNPDVLQITGPYRWVRHPMTAFALLFLWAQPEMSPTLALLSGGFTLYIFLALPLEEHELVKRFGSSYEEYRRRVPMLVPWQPPVPPARYPPMSQSSFPAGNAAHFPVQQEK
jgi:protein-S-isoprenylcysteine O-methyltransferase Ste14